MIYLDSVTVCFVMSFVSWSCVCWYCLLSDPLVKWIQGTKPLRSLLFCVHGVGFLNWLTVRSSDQQWPGQVLKGKGKIIVIQCRLPKRLQEDSIRIQSYLDFGDFGSPKYSVGSGCMTAVLRASKVKLDIFLKFLV